MKRSVNKIADAGATRRQVEGLRAAILKNPHYLAGYRRENPRSVSVKTLSSRGILGRFGFGGIWQRADVTADTVLADDGNEQTKSTVSARDIRNWVLKCASLSRPGLKTTKLSFGTQPSLVSDADEANKAADGVAEKVILEIASLRIDGPLKLDGIVAPNVSIAIVDVEVDDIILDESELGTLLIRNARPRNWAGIYLTCEYATFDKVKLDATDDDCGDILHFGARGLKANELEIFRHRFIGGDLLNYLERNNRTDPVLQLKHFCSRSLDATNSRIGDVVIFDCAFSSLVSFRDSTISNVLKFEACVFAGLNPLNSKKEQSSGDDLFDYDDIRAAIADLRGLVLDLSRSNLGMLSIQDLLDRKDKKAATLRAKHFPGQHTALPSSGWMNFAHARAKILAIDFEYYSNTQAQLRHRLAWFEYEELHIRHVGQVPVSIYNGEEKKEPKYENREKNKSDLATSKEPIASTQPEQWKLIQKWLEHQLEGDLSKNFQAQPWTTAAKVFHASGDFYQANQILGERERLAHRSLWYKGRRWRWLLESPNIIHGFGYVLWRPFALMLALWIIGGFVYQHSFKAGYFLPNPATGGIEQMAAEPGRPWARQYPDTKYPMFNEWIYSLDVMIPVVHFSQESYWVPGYGTREAEMRDSAAYSDEARSLWQRVTSGREGGGDGLLRLWVFYWTQIILGYVGTIVIGLGLVGYLERRPPA